MIDVMYNMAAKAGYMTANMGVYVQPIVQGVNYHCRVQSVLRPAKTPKAAKV